MLSNIIIFALNDFNDFIVSNFINVLQKKSMKSQNDVESLICEKHGEKQKSTKKSNSVFSSNSMKFSFCQFALRTAQNLIAKFFIAW